MPIRRWDRVVGDCLNITVNIYVEAVIFNSIYWGSTPVRHLNLWKHPQSVLFLTHTTRNRLITSALLLFILSLLKLCISKIQIFTSFTEFLFRSPHYIKPLRQRAFFNVHVRNDLRYDRASILRPDTSAEPDDVVVLRTSASSSSSSDNRSSLPPPTVTQRRVAHTPPCGRVHN